MYRGEIAKFTPSDIDDVDLFGHSAAISGDLIVVTSQRDDDVETDSGAAYIFSASSLSDTDGDGVPDDTDQCPDSNLAPTISIDGCDSGVNNPIFVDGCSLADLIDQIVAACAEGAGTHGNFASCFAHEMNALKKDGVISGAEKEALQSCAGQAGRP